jgi:hypothetical protein
VGIALANPLQVFRTAALALFDPQLIVLGPSAFVILDTFGATGYKMQALGNTRAGLPFTVAINRRGEIVASKLGAMNRADLDAAAEAALK